MEAGIGRGGVLVAGLGNVFLGDDGFGVEVARRLAAERVPEWVTVADFGIRGIHLAYELLDGDYRTVILVDATPRGGEPGKVYLIEPDVGKISGDSAPVPTDGHGMGPEAVLRWLMALGGTPGRVLVVGCEPARLEEEMGLSEPVAGAVGEAVRLVLDVLRREAPAGTPG